MCWSTINFFDQAVKRKQEANEKLVGIPKNNDYATEKLLDYCYDQNYFKLIGTDLSSQTNTSIRQQIIFTGKLEEGDGATVFFCGWKAAKSFPKIFYIFINCSNIM